MSVCLCDSLFKMGIQSVTTFAFQEHTYYTYIYLYNYKTYKKYKIFLDPPPSPLA
jgi:hypothetical protein